MNPRHSITVLLLALLLAASIGCSTGASHLLYVTTGQGIYAFRIANKSGQSTSIFSTPFLIGNSPSGIAIHPSDNFAYVANQQDSNISLLKIDHVSGVLTEVMPRTAAGGFSPNTLLLDPGSNTLFVANLISNSVSVFSVGASGALKLVTTLSVGSQPTSLAFANSLLFVAVPNFSRIYVFSASGGAFTQVSGSPFLVSGGLASIAVDASAKFLYVPNPSANTVSVFSIQSGALSPVPGSPFTVTVTTGTTGTATDPVAAAVDASASHLYVSNFGSTSVSQFGVGSNGSLTSLNPATVSVGTNPSAIVLDPVAKYLFVSNVGSKSITELPINSDGTLGTSVVSISVPSVPTGLALTK